MGWQADDPGDPPAADVSIHLANEARKRVSAVPGDDALAAMHRRRLASRALISAAYCRQTATASRSIRHPPGLSGRLADAAPTSSNTTERRNALHYARILRACAEGGNPLLRCASRCLVRMLLISHRFGHRHSDTSRRRPASASSTKSVWSPCYSSCALA